MASSRSQSTSSSTRIDLNTPWVIPAIVITASAAILALFGVFLWQDLQPHSLLGKEVAIAGAHHVASGQKATNFTSDPPTSGNHAVQPAEAGFYEEAPSDEQLVHNLEHGYVVVYYDCSGLSKEACARLQGQLQRAIGEAGVSKKTQTSKIIVAPRPSMGNLITFTSWGRLYRADSFSRNEFLQYVQQNRDIYAPEPRAP